MSASFDPRVTPWLIHEDDFYEIDDPAAQKQFLLRYAVLAPSGHNSQPWSFRIAGESIEVYADLTRRLPVSDPTDRELLLSVGAAIANLRVAAAHFGFTTFVDYPPTGGADQPVALVKLVETCNPDEGLRRLFGAITTRHTNRTEFENREIDADALGRLCDYVENLGVAAFVPPHERTRAGQLIEEADRILMANDAWRGELADWVRPNDSLDGDGMSGDAFGIPGPLASFAPWLVRSFDMGESRGRADREFAEKAAGLIVICSNDDRVSLLRTGEKLESLLLFLTTLGIGYAFLNQPVEVPTLRRELWSLTRSIRPPQLLLRIGYARPVRTPMPRRPVDAVV